VRTLFHIFYQREIFYFQVLPFYVFFLTIYLIYRVPSGEFVKVYSPKAVIVASPSDIPPSASQVVFSGTVASFFDLSGIQESLSITHITFGQHFNTSVNSLPHSLTKLTFGQYFNKSVNSLPPSRTQLTFGQCFNQPVDLLPPSLTHLQFGQKFVLPNDFNHPVDNLPSSLTHLQFGQEFVLPVNKLPSSLLRLEFGFKFDNQVDNLPPLSSILLSMAFSTNMLITSLLLSLLLLLDLVSTNP
jgi:hypothetical protein